MKRFFITLLVIVAMVSVQFTTYAIISGGDPNDKVPRAEWDEWEKETKTKLNKLGLENILPRIASRCEIYGIIIDKKEE